MPPGTEHASSRVRLTRDDRREQLLALGVRLLSTRSVDELSIDLLATHAGISRGLLYHYFGNKHDFHRAVVRRAADDLIAVTAPESGGTPVQRLVRSLEAYVDYVESSYAGYCSLVRAAAGGDPALRDIYEEALATLTDRLFETTEGSRDTPAVRLVVRGWSSFCEQTTIAWVADPGGLTRDDLVAVLAGSLGDVLAHLPEARTCVGPARQETAGPSTASGCSQVR